MLLFFHSNFTNGAQRNKLHLFCMLFSWNFSAVFVPKHAEPTETWPSRVGDSRLVSQWPMVRNGLNFRNTCIVDFLVLIIRLGWNQEIKTWCDSSSLSWVYFYLLLFLWMNRRKMLNILMSIWTLINVIVAWSAL